MEKMSAFGGKATPAFGIDLGTTNSCISVIKEGTMPSIIDLGNGKKTMPSCVTWLGDDNFIVGAESYEMRYQEDTQYSVKKLMGSGKKVILTHDGKTKEFEPAFISSLILKELCNKASVEFGEVKDVVITVPAYFNNSQVSDTIKAGELAGLSVLKILREPTGAALLYNTQETVDGSKVSLVYDLGGGTFDISLVRLQKKIVNEELDKLYGFRHIGDDKSTDDLKVLGNDGDTELGGDDVDKELASLVLDKLRKRDVKVDNLTKESYERLVLQIEKTKKSFSEAALKVTNSLEVHYKDGVSEVLTYEIDAVELSRATEVIYKKTKKLVKTVINKNKDVRIDSIVLVGGSTKSRFIKEFIREDFPGLFIDDSLNPDEAVSLGAGLQAKIVKFGDTSMQIFDILPIAIGVLVDDIVVRMIPKDQVVPYSITKGFTTQHPGQKRLTVQIYQGNSSLPEECLKLGDLVIDNLPAKEDGTLLAVGVTLAINANGVLVCKTNVVGKTREVTLTNLFSGDTKAEEKKELTLTNKKALRWSRFAKTLPMDEKRVLEDMLVNFNDEPEKEKAIIEFIRAHKK